jgi:hypothetical protein
MNTSKATQEKVYVIAGHKFSPFGQGGQIHMSASIIRRYMVSNRAVCGGGGKDYPISSSETIQEAVWWRFFRHLKRKLT